MRYQGDFRPGQVFDCRGIIMRLAVDAVLSDPPIMGPPGAERIRVRKATAYEAVGG